MGTQKTKQYSRGIEKHFSNKCICQLNLSCCHKDRKDRDGSFTSQHKRTEQQRGARHHDRSANPPPRSASIRHGHCFKSAAPPALCEPAGKAAQDGPMPGTLHLHRRTGRSSCLQIRLDQFPLLQPSKEGSSRWRIFLSFLPSVNLTLQ